MGANVSRRHPCTGVGPAVVVGTGRITNISHHAWISGRLICATGACLHLFDFSLGGVRERSPIASSWHGTGEGMGVEWANSRQQIVSRSEAICGWEQIMRANRDCSCPHRRA